MATLVAYLLGYRAFLTISQKLSDASDIWAIHAGESLYQFGDYNLDGDTDNKDKNDLLIPNLGYESQVIE